MLTTKEQIRVRQDKQAIINRMRKEFDLHQARADKMIKALTQKLATSQARNIELRRQLSAHLIDL